MIFFNKINTRRFFFDILLITVCICFFTCKANYYNLLSTNNNKQKGNIKLALINPGTFKMGAPDNEFQSDINEHPQHKVTLTKPYYIGVYEVTQDEFTLVMGFNPSTQTGNGRLPVETLSWYDAIAFCNALSKNNGFDSCYIIRNIKKDNLHIIEADVVWQKNANGFRLPTEAEWEFACRAGTTTPFPFGNKINTNQANYSGTCSFMDSTNTCHLREETIGIDRGLKLPVDSLAANTWGLYNMVGNVFEWVWDYYGKYPNTDQINPTGPTEGVRRVRRSGSFTSPGYHMRSALRHDVPPGLPLFHQGLRVARNAE
jgi:formylglycine-generating enzyme